VPSFVIYVFRGESKMPVAVVSTEDKQFVARLIELQAEGYRVKVRQLRVKDLNGED